MLQWVVLLVVLAAAVLVLVDSARLGARRGALGGGLLDIGPVGWFVCVLLVWFVALPAYLVARRRLVALGAAGSTPVQAPVAPAEAAATPAAAPAPVRERGRHRAAPASRTRRPARAGRSARTRGEDLPAAPAAAAAPVVAPAPAAAVVVKPEPLAPPFAAATSWAAIADEPPLLEDQTVGAFAPGEPVPGPFAAQPWSTESFVGGDEPADQQYADQYLEQYAEQYAEPVAGPAPVESEPLAVSPADSPYLSRFAELCADGLMSQAELDRVRARLSGTPTP